MLGALPGAHRGTFIVYDWGRGGETLAAFGFEDPDEVMASLGTLR